MRCKHVQNAFMLAVHDVIKSISTRLKMYKMIHSGLPSGAAGHRSHDSAIRCAVLV